MLEGGFAGGGGVVEGVFFLLACNSLLGSFDADFLHRYHHCADEFIAALETEKLVLPIALVEEDNVQIDGLDLYYVTDFR